MQSRIERHQRFRHAITTARCMCHGTEQGIHKAAGLAPKVERKKG